MTKLAKLQTSIRVAELSGTATNILQTYADLSPIEDETLQSIIDELDGQNKEMILALEKDKVISELEKYDEARDRAYINIYYFMKGQELAAFSSFYAQVKTVYDTVMKYGLRITRLSYNEQTAQINSFLADLESEENVAALKTISQISGLIQILTTAQREFEQAYSRYLSKLNERKGQKNASEIKPKLLFILNDKLVVYMRSAATFTANTHGIFAGELALAINKTNQNIKERNRQG